MVMMRRFVVLVQYAHCHTLLLSLLLSLSLSA